MHRERQAVEPARELGIEVQDIVVDMGAGVIPLDKVERPGHDTHVDAFLRSPALDVIGITVQRDQEPVPRALGVDGGKYSGMGDKAQRRAVRSTPVVVRDVPVNGRRTGAVEISRGSSCLSRKNSITVSACL
jgi:hypothetical protein